MRFRDLLRAWRWLLNAECTEPFCHQRRICWRWHVETATCPTCKHTVAEDESGFAAALYGSPYLAPVIVTGPPQTWGGAVTTFKETV